MKVAGVVLAAGASRRFGQPKALAQWNGKTFARWVLDAMGEAGLYPCVLVLGHEADTIRSRLGQLPARVAINKQPERGQFSSLQEGIRAVAAECEAAIVALVDQPQVPVDIFRALKARLHSAPGSLVLPRVRGKRAHPVGISACWFSEILAMDPARTLRDFLHAHGDAVVYLDVSDELLLVDVDEPSDLERLAAAWKRGEGVL
ncbi:MAG: nucleotidyltransferase family protein [candidate division KSB1 bacterium]|nr:nucleotidyltransferase family protein [candidate division KSB1 bacterium]